MHRVANLTSYRYSNSCTIEMKQMFDKMAHFRKTVQYDGNLNLTFPTSFW